MLRSGKERKKKIETALRAKRIKKIDRYIEQTSWLVATVTSLADPFMI